MKIGLTGGMGCGKSLILAAFAEQGCATAETDALVRRLLAEDAEVIAAVRERFGEAVFEHGQIDRQKVASAVFGDEQALGDLETILHPRVRRAWQSLASGSTSPHVVVEIPLLFEKNLENQFDITVCVSAGLHVQLSRLSGRGFTREQAKARMARQLPLAEKEKRADYVISNNGTTEFARAQVSQLLNLLS